MKKLIQTALRRPVTVFMFYLGLILLGVLSLRELAVDLFPPLEFPEIIVHTTYPDALPEEVEQNITRPLEEAVTTVSGVKQTFSRSFYGESLITVRMSWGTDMKYAALALRQQIDRVFAYLPEKARRPVVTHRSPQNRPILTLVLTGSDLPGLNRFAEYIVKRRLEQIRGIAEAAILGAPVREIRVNFDPNKLQAQGFSVEAIRRALDENNLIVSGGSVKKGNFRLALRVKSEYLSIDEIKETPVFPQKGRPVPLKKIAEVIDGFKERESLARINGRLCIALDLRRESGGNTVQITERVNEVIEQLKNEYSNVKFETVYSQSEFIERTINSVIQAIALGGILAFVVLFFFLANWRAPVIIAVSIPLSILAAFLLMKFSNISLNIISLAGLALGSGMLVDNSIVVLENIHRWKEKGLSFFEAALKGTAEVAMPISASTITTIAVFLPVIFLKDLSGAIFTEQAKTVSYALFSSLLVSLTLLPVLYVFFNRRRKISAQNSLINQNRLGKVEIYYKRFMDWCLRHKTLFLTSVAVIFVFVLFLSFLLDRRLLPDTEQHALQIKISYLPSVSMDYIERKSAVLEKEFQQDERIKMIYAQLGRKQGVFFNAEERKLNRSSIYLKVKEDVSSGEMINYYMKRTGAGERIQFDFRKIQTALNQLLGERSYPLNVEISGSNLAMLDSIGRIVYQRLKNWRGDLIAGTNYFERYPAVVLEVDRKKVVQYGLTVQQISNSVSAALKGKTATTFRDFDKKIDILLRSYDRLQRDLNEILNIRINNYPLKEFVEIRYCDDLNVIERKNQNRLFQINLLSAGENLNQLAASIKKLISDIPLPAGYQIKLGGEWLESMQSLKTLLFAFILAVALVYLVLAAQFESFKAPFIIMFTIPLAVIGIVPALMISGLSLNIMSAIGLVVIVGIVVNDGIIKIDFIRRAENEGHDLTQAIHLAGKMRLRPILMTTVTTVLGLLPLALGIGQGAELQQPMAVAIIGGISVSTLLTLFVLPLLYVIFSGKKITD